MDTTSSSKTTKRFGNKLVGALIWVALIVGSIVLQVHEFISEPSFVIFILAACLIGLFIAYSERVKSLNIKSGELVLSEIERKHEDILKLEVSVRELASATLDMVEVSRAGSWAVTEEEDKKYDSAKNRLTKLLSNGQ